MPCFTVEDELTTTKNTKRTGEFSEAAFLHRAEGLAFKLAKPWGDSERYDFILDSGTRLWKVQVKGTEALRARGYEVRASYTNRQGPRQLRRRRHRRPRRPRHPPRPLVHRPRRRLGRASHAPLLSPRRQTLPLRAIPRSLGPLPPASRSPPRPLSPRHRPHPLPI